MAEKRIVLLDTNIISRVLKGQAKYVGAVGWIGPENIIVSSVTQMELRRWLFEYKVDGAAELKKIRNAVELLKVIHIDRSISLKALGFYAHHKQLSMKVPDMLVAATALHLNLPLFTTNLKDFRFIKGLRLYLAPNLTNNG